MEPTLQAIQEAYLKANKAVHNYQFWEEEEWSPIEAAFTAAQARVTALLEVMEAAELYRRASDRAVRVEGVRMNVAESQAQQALFNALDRLVSTESRDHNECTETRHFLAAGQPVPVEGATHEYEGACRNVQHAATGACACNASVNGRLCRLSRINPIHQTPPASATARGDG